MSRCYFLTYFLLLICDAVCKIKNLRQIKITSFLYRSFFIETEWNYSFLSYYGIEIQSFFKQNATKKNSADMEKTS